MNFYYILVACVAIVTLTGTAVTVGIAWGTVTQRQSSHEAQDSERYEETSRMLREMRDDIKTILSTR